VWTGFSWLRRGTSGVPLRTRQVTVEFHNIWGIPRTYEQLSASQEGWRYTELLNRSSPQFSSVTPKAQLVTRNRQDVGQLHCQLGKAV